MIRILFLALYLFSIPVFARMFQWVDPESGTTQLSGVPPAWYRNGEPGPRVFVFENGKVIDDTEVAVAEDERERLRREAFIQAHQDQQAYLDRMMEAKRVKAVMERKLQKLEAVAAEELPDDVPEEILPAPVTAPAAPTAEELRALIDAWEDARTRDARQTLEGTPAGAPPSD